MNMEHLIEIKDLRVEFHTERAVTKALNGVNLTIDPGESLGLVGESGAGKTTTALSMLQMLPKPAGRFTGGDILYKGQSLMKFSDRKMMDIRGNKISMIFQNPLTSLNPVFSVGEQIAMVLRRHRKMSRKEAVKEAQRLMEMVSIPGNRFNDYPVQFSGGMRQRIGIAAGLACNTELLIADEPTTALDVTIQAQVLQLLKELQVKEKTALLMITHNLGIVSELCENIAVMYGGQIIEYGKAQEVFSNPAHPYTVGLLASLPTLTGSRNELYSIPGTVANPQNLPEGCYFHPRCQKCMHECREKQPEMIKLNEYHYVSCFNHG